MKDQGIASYILGIKIERNDHQISLSQEEYQCKLLNKFKMHDSRPVTTPLNLGIKNALSNNPNITIHFPYKQALGCLMYVMLCTRPDLAFPICFLNQFSNHPTQSHWQALKRVMHYIKGTMKYKLRYEKDNESLISYSDVEWDGDLINRKSTFGFVFLLENGAISWSSKKTNLCPII